MESNNHVQWFAMRVCYGRELRLKERLTALDINCFIPMQIKEEIKKGVKIKKWVPVVHNLIFIQSSRKSIDVLRKQFENIIPMFYMIDKATNTPIVIPDQEMRNFIAVAGIQDEQVVYLNDINAAIRKGDRVQVVGGVFNGIEGEVLRIKRNRRVVVTIKGVLAVATTFIDSSLLRRI